MLILAGTVVLALVVACALGELVTRLVFGRHLEYKVCEGTRWELRPRQRGFVLAGRPAATINGAGFRGAEPSPASGRRRIVLVGDSFAFGYGVADDETLAHFIEGELRSAHGAEVEVLNLGVPGYGVHQMDALVRKTLDRYRPDVVILQMVKADVLRQPPASQTSGAWLDEGVRAVLRRSALAAIVMPPLKRALMVLRGTDAASILSEAVVRELWARDAGRINALHAYLAGRGIPLVFVPYTAHESHRALVEMARSDLNDGILIVDDMYRRMREYSLEHHEARIENDLLRIPDDNHPTGASYRIAAEAVVETLVKANLV